MGIFSKFKNFIKGENNNMNEHKLFKQKMMERPEVRKFNTKLKLDVEKYIYKTLSTEIFSEVTNLKFSDEVSLDVELIKNTNKDIKNLAKLSTKWAVLYGTYYLKTDGKKVTIHTPDRVFTIKGKTFVCTDKENNTGYIVERYELTESGIWACSILDYTIGGEFKLLQENYMYYAQYPLLKVNVNDNGICEDVKHLIDDLQLMYSSLVTEIKNGRSRIYIPERNVSRTDAIRKTYSEEVVTYDAIDKDASIAPTVYNPQLRIAEHEQALKTQLLRIAKLIQIDSDYLNYDALIGSSTATEYLIKNRKDVLKVNQIKNSILTGIMDIVNIGLVFNNIHYLVDYNLTDGIVESDNSETERIINLYEKGLISHKEAIKRIHGYTDEQAEQMISEINATNSTPPI